MEIDAKILEKFGILKNTKDVHTPSTLHEKIEAEKTIELAMIRSGINRFHKTIRKAKAKVSEKSGKPRETNESTTIYGQVLIQQGLEPLCEALNKYFNETAELGKELQLYRILSEKHYQSENRARDLLEAVLESSASS